VSKVEIRRRPALMWRYGNKKSPLVEVLPETHLRLVGYVPGYAVVRRKGCVPFCLPRREWDGLPIATMAEEARTES
jgi:hypothetical protein